MLMKGPLYLCSDTFRLYGSLQRGYSVFYKTLNENSHDFQLHRWGTVGGKYAMMAAADTQPRGEKRIPSAFFGSFP